MDFTFTEEQQAAAETARTVSADVAPDAVPSPALTPAAVADDLDRRLWRRLAATDLLGLLVDPEHGGAGLDPIALCLVLRESARALARVPLLETAAVTHVLGHHAPAATAAALLPEAAAGRLVLTAAAHGATGHEPAERSVTARPADDHWILDGTTDHVPWAHQADLTAVPAHTADGRTVLALLRRDQTGLTLDAQYGTHGERLARLRLDGVRLPADRALDSADAWPTLRALLTTGTCALALGLGLGEQVLTMTSRYTGKREQFGHPMATFQAVAVQAADRYIDLRAMEATLGQAAWRVTTGAEAALPVEADLAVAKIWAAGGVRRVVQTAQHPHGGFGADTDYPLHRYHAWAKYLELSLGPAAAHEESLGDLIAAHPLD
ncbi:acyl-CoA dehydrogenase family protein [Streptomyces roseolus]|uniref:acyl-CoA dehydrogenase family protein n=1 Tax=Streptomyces roseolus TaxID=67358 RepID=UPI001679FEC8|nr:acyl-CoA dehydrogenase family protein [Streptomyces roseolus]GGR14717.1 putative acyl-CoA dehydrogenase [Streptomyces roseolus]